MDRYMRSARRALVSALYEELFGSEHEEEEREAPAPAAPKESESKESETEEAKESKESKKSKENKKDKKKDREEAPLHSFFFRSSTFRRGKDVVEEHRERVVNEDGSVHVVTRRQLGDRWSIHESHTKDGSTSSKETWHNVPEDAISSFEAEWKSSMPLHCNLQAPLSVPAPEPSKDETVADQ